jgi:hypothetical protein
MTYDPDEHIEFGSLRELVANGIRKDYEKSDAWKQGYQDGKNKGRVASSPYSDRYGSPEAEDWIKGYQVGWKEYCEKHIDKLFRE